MHKGTFAARAGRWSAHHRKTAILGWLGFVVACVVAGQLVGMKSSTPGHAGWATPAGAETLFSDHFPKSADESVLVQAPRGATVRDPEVRRAVADVVGAVQGKPRVAKVASPYAAGNADQISQDGRSALVTFEVRGDDAQTSKAIDPVVAAVDRVQGASTPASSSASSATRARARRWTRPSATTSRRPRRCRCRSRC